MALPFDTLNSEAYKTLSPDGVFVLVEMEKKWVDAKYGGKSKDENRIICKPSEYKGRITEYLFYKGRAEVAELGFYDEIEKGGMGHKPSIFRKSAKWEGISQVMKEKKEKQTQSERDKARHQVKNDQDGISFDKMLSGDEFIDELLKK